MSDTTSDTRLSIPQTTQTATQKPLSDLTDRDVARMEADYETGLAELTDQQRRFVESYIVTGKGVASAIDAGCTSKTVAGVTAARYLADDRISRLIGLVKRVALHRNRVRLDETLTEVKLLAFSDISNYLFDEQGKPIKTPENEAIWRAVQSYEPQVIYTRGGDPIVRMKVKLWSKPDALRLLLQHLGELGGEGADHSAAPPAVIVVGLDVDAIAGRAQPLKVESRPTDQSGE